MNIWIFNHYAVKPDLPGGTRHYDLARELTKRGHNTTVFASSFHYSLHKEMKLLPGEKWRIDDTDGVRFVWLRTTPYKGNDWRRVVNILSYMVHSWWLGRRLPRFVPDVGKPDVIVGSSVHLLAVLSALWVARYQKAKFVMEVRDLWPQTLIDMGKLSVRNPITWLLRALEKFLYLRAILIITLPPFAHKYISSRGAPSRKTIWIPNGVCLDRFGENELRDSAGGGLTVMYLGAHGEANALDVVLQAAKVIEDQGWHKIKFVFVGDGSEKSRLIKMTKDLDLKNVEFRDPIGKAQVPEALSEADAFIFNLEKAEVFKYGISPNKLFDYMAAGKPIIFAVEACNNPIEEAHCGFTAQARDPQAIAEAIIKLYQMPNYEREALGKRGRKYIEANHAIPLLAERMIRCVESNL